MANGKTEHLKTQFIEKITDNMQSFGVSTTVGRVLGIIYMERRPMTLDELSEETGMSKTRMSQVVREMIDLNIAERVFRKGVRKDLYEVEQDYYQTFVSLFTSTWNKAINKNAQFEQRLKGKIDAIENKENLPEEEEQLVNEILQEMHEWMSYYDWIKRLVAFFESGEIFNHVPKHIHSTDTGGNSHE
ncbi:GbsR/MarR family transcriptional regulator [Virgibacillus xinjiangensis]|uniref:HTH-type transcriptional regulator n=1 Tax=Virgibacillus xinjiangensis TaxID=393090 RepID=A0ABV7CYE6_9BACI